MATSLAPASAQIALWKRDLREDPSKLGAIVLALGRYQKQLQDAEALTQVTAYHQSLQSMVERALHFDLHVDISNLHGIRATIAAGAYFPDLQGQVADKLAAIDRMITKDLERRTPQFLEEWRIKLEKKPYPLNDAYHAMCTLQAQLSAVDDAPDAFGCWIEQVGQLIVQVQSFVTDLLATNLPDITAGNLPVLLEKLKGVNEIDPTQERVREMIDLIEVRLSGAPDEWVLVDEDLSWEQDMRTAVKNQAYDQINEKGWSEDQIFFITGELIKHKAWEQGLSFLEKQMGKRVAGDDSTFIPVLLLFASKSKKPETERKYSTDAIIHDPHLNLSLFSKGLRELDKADEWAFAFGLALKIESTEPDLRVFRGLSYNRQKNWALAIEEFTVALKLGDHPDAFKGLADAYEGMGQPEMAKEQIRQLQLCRHDRNAAEMTQLHEHIDFLTRFAYGGGGDSEASAKAEAADLPPTPKEEALTYAYRVLLRDLNAQFDAMRKDSIGQSVLPSSAAASVLGAAPVFGPALSWCANRFSHTTLIDKYKKVLLFFPHTEAQIPILKRVAEILRDRYANHLCKLTDRKSIELVCQAMVARIYAYLTQDPPPELKEESLSEDLALGIQRMRGVLDTFAESLRGTPFARAVPEGYRETLLNTNDPMIQWTPRGIFDESPIRHSDRLYVHRKATCRDDRYPPRGFDPRELEEKDDFGSKLWVVRPIIREPGQPHQSRGGASAPLDHL